MTFSCIGQKLIGILNGNIITKATDSQLSAGKNGFFVSTYEEGNFSINYSNYLVLSGSIPPTPSSTPTDTRTPTNTKTTKPTNTPRPTRTPLASSTSTQTVTSTQQPTLVPTKSPAPITTTPNPQEKTVLTTPTTIPNEGPTQQNLLISIQLYRQDYRHPLHLNRRFLNQVSSMIPTQG